MLTLATLNLTDIIQKANKEKLGLRDPSFFVPLFYLISNQLDSLLLIEQPFNGLFGRSS